MERSARFNDQRSLVQAWANQHCLQGHASHLFFEGDTIFSYGMHYPLATQYRGVFFVNDKRYSVTTSAHKSLVLDAIGVRKVIPVDVLPVDVDPRYARDFQERNLLYWLGQIQQWLQELVLHPRRYSLDRKIMACEDVISTFMHVLGISPSKALGAVLRGINLDNVTAFLQHPPKGCMFKAAPRQLNPKQHFSRLLALWEKGVIPAIAPSDVPEGMGDIAHLRYNAQTKRIETSKDVEVPVALAYKCWRSLQEHRARKQYSCNIPLLRWHVSRIAPTHIIINCHSIPVRQVQKIARQLGWKYPEPATLQV